MSTQMIIRLDDDLKTKLTRLARAEGKNTSAVVRELIENYIVEHDIESYIDDLWNRIGKKLRNRNIGIKEINKVIHESRAARK